MKRLALASAVSAAVGAFAPVAMAETADATGDTSIVVAQAQQRVAEPGAQRSAPARRAFSLPSERVEARLAYARTALKITDAQQTQWESFANVLRKHARAMDQRFQERRAQREAGGAGMRRADQRNVSAIERLERQQQRTTQRAARLNEVIAAAKPLYAVFSPEQKQVADSMLARGGRGGHRHHHRGMHRGPAA